MSFADALFASGFAKRVGQRTYSIYVAHFPILLLLLTLCARLGHSSALAVALVLLVVGLAAAVAVVEAVHRLVSWRV